MAGAGNQATALLTDRASGIELWSKTKGGSWAMSGWSNAWVERALAKSSLSFSIPLRGNSTNRTGVLRASYFNLA